MSKSDLGLNTVTSSTTVTDNVINNDASLNVNKEAKKSNLVKVTVIALAVIAVIATLVLLEVNYKVLSLG